MRLNFKKLKPLEIAPKNNKNTENSPPFQNSSTLSSLLF